MQRTIVSLTGSAYQTLLKPLLFTLNPESVHTTATSLGQTIGNNRLATSLLKEIFCYSNKALEQKIAGIPFKNPIILSAGFDYEARLTQLLPSFGFGGETIGTITNHPYEGNPKPRLGRLPRSKSLLVNKGFKNDGAQKTIERLSGLSFAIQIGVSIGRTNSKTILTQKESINDILQAFIAFEKSNVHHSYYELNISCPNLYGDVSFYPPSKLKELLQEIDKLHLKRPVFIKMPIEKTNKDVLAMLHVITSYSPKGVIFGNLQKDRSDKTFDPTEIKKATKGNFSGKPTFQRSNELIQLSYRHFPKLPIIGCGGVFNANDAYTKITLGASLIELITGMIFVGPQVIGEINRGLVDLLKKDGFTHISQAIGTRNK